MEEKKATVYSFLVGEEEAKVIDEFMQKYYKLSKSEVIRRLIIEGANSLRKKG